MNKKDSEKLSYSFECNVLKVDAKNRNGDYITRSSVEHAIVVFNANREQPNNGYGKIFLQNEFNEETDTFLIGWVDSIYINDDGFMVVKFHTLDKPMAKVFSSLLRFKVPLGLGMTARYNDKYNNSRYDGTDVFDIQSFFAYPLANPDDVSAGLAMKRIDFELSKDMAYLDAEEEYDVVDENYETKTKDLDATDFADGVEKEYDDGEVEACKCEEEDYYYDFQVAPYALIDVCEALYWNGLTDACITKEDGDIHIRWKRDLSRRNHR